VVVAVVVRVVVWVVVGLVVSRHHPPIVEVKEILPVVPVDNPKQRAPQLSKARLVQTQPTR